MVIDEVRSQSEMQKGDFKKNKELNKLGLWRKSGLELVRRKNSYKKINS